MPNGYGYLSYGTKGRLYAHRAALELSAGPPPSERSYACHTCDVRLCVNPSHLYWGTVQTNNQDRKDRSPAETESCERGHEWTPENTYRYVTAEGYPARQCRACAQIRTGVQSPRGPGWMTDTHCRNGHVLADVGVLTGGGRRRCRACVRAQNRRSAGRGA